MGSVCNAVTVVVEAKKKTIYIILDDENDFQPLDFEIQGAVGTST